MRRGGAVCLCRSGQRLSRQHVGRREPGHQDLQDVHPAVQGSRQIRQRRVQVGRTPPKKSLPKSNLRHLTLFCSVQILFLSSGATNWVGLILWRFGERRSSLSLLLLLCRFRHGYCKGNPRKMVRTWAEKEMRNLIRLQTAGIPSPEPLLLRSHVLLMSFIGKDNM